MYSSTSKKQFIHTSIKSHQTSNLKLSVIRQRVCHCTKTADLSDMWNVLCILNVYAATILGGGGPKSLVVSKYTLHCSIKHRTLVYLGDGKYCSLLVLDQQQSPRFMALSFHAQQRRTDSQQYKCVANKQNMKLKWSNHYDACVIIKTEH